jgi:glycosyltransferase involved in cell wall biosynthesis
MKILHSYKVYRPEVDGGIPFVMAELSRMSEIGIDNSILVARRQGFARNYQHDGVDVEAVTSLGTLFSMPIAPTFPIRMLQRARSSDVVVHHAPFPLSDLAAAQLPSKVGLVVYWHADIVGFSLLGKLVTPAINAALRRADKIIVSHEATAEHSPFLAQFRDKWAVVPYCTEIDYWTTCSAEENARVEELRKSYPRLVVGTGRLVPYKGYRHLITAIKDIDAQLILIGEGELKGELEELSRDLGVSDRVKLVGRISRSEIKSYLHAARLFAFPSVTPAEAFGIAQLEAMAAGLPIVNTSLPTAVPHIARHDREALTVPVNDVPALKSAIERILDDPALANRLGEAGRKRVQEEYSRERFQSRMHAIYDDVVQRRRSAN